MTTNWSGLSCDIKIHHIASIGLQTVEWAKAQDYNWSGLSQQPSLTAKAKRSLLQFTPYSWDDFQWRAFSTPKRCIQSLGLLTVFLLMEVRGTARGARHGPSAAHLPGSGCQTHHVCSTSLQANIHSPSACRSTRSS